MTTISLSANKACGLDNIFAEHLVYASPSVHPLLSICFNAFIVHGFIPSDLTDTVLLLVHIVKEKTREITYLLLLLQLFLKYSKYHCSSSL